MRLLAVDSRLSAEAACSPDLQALLSTLEPQVGLVRVFVFWGRGEGKNSAYATLGARLGHDLTPSPEVAFPQEYPVVVCFASVRAGGKRLPLSEVLSRPSLYPKTASRAREGKSPRGSQAVLAVPLPLSVHPPVW